MPDTGLILGLLAVVATAAAIGRRLGLAGPIVFAIGGVALALVPGIPSIALPPSLGLAILLPPLIFAAAQDTFLGGDPKGGAGRTASNDSSDITPCSSRAARSRRTTYVSVRATRRLLEELADVERAELQCLQNAGIVDHRLAPRVQQGLDTTQPLGGGAGAPTRT
jgi:hypothetical protein